jgi:N-acetyl-anhydromuramyl-L-alanine amidase AmpD
MSALFIKSPNFTQGRKGFKPIAIVIHIMEGTLDGTDSWFGSRSSNVSAHYGIGKNGELHQYVKEEDTAWHAGRVDHPSWKLIKPAEDEAGMYINPNYYTIGIEHEGSEDTDWTEEMYATSSDLIAAIAQRWDITLDRDHVVGHHEIYSLKDCPGTKVDLNRLIAQAGGAPPAVPEWVVIKTGVTGKATTKNNVNIRRDPSTRMVPLASVPPGIQLAYDGYTEVGQSIDGNSKWYYTDEGNWFWSGAMK